MNETIKTLLNRRSIRNFKDEQKQKPYMCMIKGEDGTKDPRE